MRAQWARRLSIRSCEFDISTPRERRTKKLRRSWKCTIGVCLRLKKTLPSPRFFEEHLPRRKKLRDCSKHHRKNDAGLSRSQKAPGAFLRTRRRRQLENSLMSL